MSKPSGTRRRDPDRDDTGAVLASNKRARLGRKRHTLFTISSRSAYRVSRTGEEREDKIEMQDTEGNPDKINGDQDVNEDEGQDKGKDREEGADASGKEYQDQIRVSAGSSEVSSSTEENSSSEDEFGWESDDRGFDRRSPHSSVIPVTHLTDAQSEPIPPLAEEERVKLIAQVSICAKVTRSVYDSLQSMPNQRFREEAFPSSYKLRQRLKMHTSVKIADYDMCLHGCRAYTGPYNDDTMCQCDEPRLNRRGTPKAVFHYLPLLDRLQRMFRNRELAMKLAYPVQRTCERNVYGDIYDGDWYRNLRKSKVVWDGQEYNERYFAAATDLALSLGIDGIPCFKRNGIDCWPIVITLYSLNPELRHRQEYQICCGVIPGNRDISTQREFNIDSFLKPLIDELRILATDGVASTGWVYNPAQRILEWKTFVLRAHLLTVSGDMPAIAKVMHFKGHNGKYPCRCCNMPAIRVSEESTYYMTCRTKDDPADPDYADLPLRTHARVQQTAYNIEEATTAKKAEELAREAGIQGQLPLVLPLDLMHVLYENIMKQLLNLWEGKYKLKVINGDAKKKLDGNYVISTADWAHIDAEIAQSTRLVPAQIAPSLKSVTKRSFWNADSYSYFLMHAGPIVLRDRLASPYYEHFIELSKLTITVTQPKITKDEVKRLEDGFVAWVKRFEELYYRFDPKFLPVCTAPIHALLHIVQYIRQQGPPCQYWCFYIERLGAYIKRQVIRNKKKPFETLHNRLLIEQQLHELITQLDDPDAIIKWRAKVSPVALDWSTATADAEVDTHPPYRGRLSEKERPDYDPDKQVYRALKRYLEAEVWTFERQRSKTLITYSDARMRLVGRDLEFWRVFRGTSDNGRYIIRTARSLNEGEKRDSSWIRFMQYEDKKPSVKTVDASWEPVFEYGEVIEFLSFRWEGDVRCVFVIQPASIKGNWVPGMEQGKGPQLIGVVGDYDGEAGPLPLQVVDLRAIVTVAGRIPLSGVLGTVVFDISNGVLDPEEKSEPME